MQSSVGLVCVGKARNTKGTKREREKIFVLGERGAGREGEDTVERDCHTASRTRYDSLYRGTARGGHTSPCVDLGGGGSSSGRVLGLPRGTSR